MESPKVNCFAFCPNDYASSYLGEPSEEDLARMRKDIGDFIDLCIRNKYIVSVRTDSLCTIVEYDYANEEYGGPILRWVDPDKWERFEMSEIPDEEVEE